MVFSSFIFIFGFLPIFLWGYFLAPTRWRNVVLLLASYLFYAWGAPKIVPALILSSIIDYVISRQMCIRGLCRRRLLLMMGVSLNVGLLGYYKYANLLVNELNRLLALFEFKELPWSAIVLPIGISFFSFQKISYLVDVYRGSATPAKSLVNYLLYVVSFPQLIAGPIVRYHDISQEIEQRRHSLAMVFDGMCRFSVGLGKKVLIADPMGNVARNVWRLEMAELSSPYAWLGMVCYAYQIYFDFSGYSDMAIGLGRMMGFHFLENFDRPYRSQSFTEFWQRWHISLSRWMRDYLYIPLGGNRVSRFRTYLNLWIVFVLSGLWHGANWTFVAWGCFNGLFLTLERLFWLKVSARLPRAANILLTFVLVSIGFVFFRADTFAEAFRFLSHAFQIGQYWDSSVPVLRGTVIHNQGLFTLALATVLAFAPFPRWLRVAWSETEEGGKDLLLPTVRFAFCILCLVLSVLALATTSYAPFIYFRF